MGETFSAFGAGLRLPVAPGLSHSFCRHLRFLVYLCAGTNLPAHF
jgi:hypothetical protein